MNSDNLKLDLDQVRLVQYKKIFHLHPERKEFCLRSIP